MKANISILSKAIFILFVCYQFTALYSCCGACCGGNEAPQHTLMPGYYIPYQVDSFVKVNYVMDSLNTQFEVPKTIDSMSEWIFDECDEPSTYQKRIIEFYDESDNFKMGCELSGGSEQLLWLYVSFHDEVMMADQIRLYPESDSVFYEKYDRSSGLITSGWTLFDSKMRIREVHRLTLERLASDTTHQAFFLSYE